MPNLSFVSPTRNSPWGTYLSQIDAVEPYLGNPNYILDVDLADKAITWMRMQHALAPSKPWLLYYCTGTAHAPHHAPKDWIAKYKGQFDQGWDKVREETLARQKICPGWSMRRCDPKLEF